MRFKRHIHNHIQKEIKGPSVKLKEKFLCKPCDIIFEIKSLFEQHQHQHTLKEPRIKLDISPHKESKLICNKCGKRFTSNIFLQKHFEKSRCCINRDIEKYRCDQCDYESSQKGMLVIHKRVKHNGLAFNCDKCEFESGYPNSTMRHMRKVHKTIVNMVDSPQSLI